jgi:MraZ protein
VFLGESTVSLDAKFRLVVPKRIAEQLDRDAEGRLACVLTRGQDRCIYLFSRQGFERALATLRPAAFTGVDQRAAQRVFLASTFEVEIDSAGRVLVPEKLRPQLDGERELAVIGNVDHAEVWGRSAWETYQARNEPLVDRIDRILGGHSEES